MVTGIIRQYDDPSAGAPARYRQICLGTSTVGLSALAAITSLIAAR
jgi:hypothetical protein